MRKSTRVRALVSLAAVLVLLTAIGSPSAAPARPAPVAEGDRGAVAGGTGVVAPSLIDHYLEHTPGLGPVTVIDIASETPDRKLLAATLQGIVNRTSARIYLLGARSYGEDAYWLDQYTSHGLITVTATVGLDTALHTFKSEVAGYVVATTSEPWTINTATSAAGATGGVVATPTTIALLQGEGLTQLADHRGRWTDAATAYEDTADEYRSSLDYGGVAIQQPDRHQPRDLLVQQGVFTVYTRPSFPDYDRIYDVLETFPSDRATYGYVSDTGAEEVTAIVRLSQTGRFLIPTDGTDNLSFHLAVGGSQRALPGTADQTAPTAPCTTDQVNVVVAFSDGDNLGIAEAYYPAGNRWGSPRRGELPMGWGLTPAAAILMPAIWDHYVSTATANDEVVDIMGLGYALPTLMPDGATFLADSMRLRSTLGVATHWSLDALITKPDASGWAKVHEATVETGVPPSGILLNYAKWPGPAWYRTIDQTPVLASQQGAYESGPSELAGQVQALVDLPAAERPLVNFIPATVWNVDYDQLADAMAPFAAEDVRFLTPSQAIACLPPPPPTTTTTTSPGAPTATTVPAAPAADPVGGSPTYIG